MFVLIDPWEEKPVVLDDTCYFLGCKGLYEAETLAGMLNSDPARQFLSSLTFRDGKRPITAAVLRRLNLVSLARELGLTDLGKDFFEDR